MATRQNYAFFKALLFACVVTVCQSCVRPSLNIPIIPEGTDIKHRPRKFPTRSREIIILSAGLSPFGGEKKGMEVAIQISQLLLDTTRRNQLKTKMKQQFPVVSDAVVDSSIDITAQAFTRVAPETLKTALKPGGME